MLIFAHRGRHGGGVGENTLAAFRAAAALGLGVETDVRLDRGGVPYLFHDRRIRGVAVAGLSLAELREAAGFAVPRLDEALEACPDVFWNLEIKEDAVVAPLCARLRRFSGRVLVSSFLHDAVAACARQAGVAGGLLLSHRPLRPQALLTGAGDGISTLIWHFATADAASLRRAAEAGATNWIYGFDAPEDHASVPAGLAAAVITDFPGEIAKPGGRTPGAQNPGANDGD